MKYLRVKATPDPNATPVLFRLIADSRHVEETRLLEMNVVDSRGITCLFSMDGDAAATERALSDVDGVVSADVTPTGDGRFYLLATFSPGTMPLVAGVFRALTSDGLVVLKPVVYRDGEVTTQLVGETRAVQAALDALPAAVDVAVHEIGEHGFELGSAAASLSDRQRAAVDAALDLGYYDTPRRATHEDLARRLDCAPSTASEHLQRAEAKLVRTGMAAAPEPNDR